MRFALVCEIVAVVILPFLMEILRRRGALVAAVSAILNFAKS